MAQNTTDSGEKARRRCREIMTAAVRTASAADPLNAVSTMMRDGDVGSVPIVDGERLIGIITDRDIVVRAVADGKSPDTPVSEVMTTEIFSVRPDAFVFEAIRLMGDRQIRRVPVVDEDGRLAGIIAMADIALETEDQREIAETLEDISTGVAFWKRDQG